MKNRQENSNGGGPSHTPISNGTSARDSRDALREAVRRVAEPVFLKAVGEVPQETNSDTMGIGPVSESGFRLLWRPNNYRRKINIKLVSDTGIKNIRQSFQNVKLTKKKVLFVRSYPGVLLEVGRHTLTGIWAQPKNDGEKQTHLIARPTMEGIAVRISERVEEIEAQIDAAINDFLKITGLRLAGAEIKRSRYEDWIKGEEFIDSLPGEMIIHDTVFKKVYGDGVEFKQTLAGEAPGAHVKNYIKNRAVEDFAPEIAASIDGVQQQLVLLMQRVDNVERLDFYPSPVMEQLQAAIGIWPQDFFRDDNQGLWGGLSSREKSAFSEWTFERFGGGA